VIDPKGEAAGSGGKPIPHFFPAPALPATLKASNYDNGGEGIAFHSSRPLPERARYRADDFGLLETSDAGGGYALAAMGAGDWARYSIDCGNGGYFDLTVRAASAHGGGRLRFVALDQTVALVDIPATGSDEVYGDVRVQTLYLNPGELSLMVFVETPGAVLNTFTLQPAAKPLSIYPAALAFRRGVVGLTGLGDPAHPLGFIRNLGRAGSSLLFGVNVGTSGPGLVRVRYASNEAVPVALTLTEGDAPGTKLAMAPTAGAWKTIDVPVNLPSGSDRILIEGNEADWNSVQVDQIEILPK
ncbi:MAG TPA: carbohydrate-binding protein, partial [Opitutaceae bacterium]